MLTTNNETKTPAVLILQQTEIHSLPELREHFDAEEILQAQADGTLPNWLEQHYYEKEADRLRFVEVEDDKRAEALKTICTALGISHTDARILTDEERAKLEVKRKLVAEYTDDEAILSDVSRVAMNQEELAKLLDDGEKKIYLCKGTFSVPIRVADISYIGIGNATIENPYTEEQYKKAGITITGIPLATSVDPDMSAAAYHAAVLNGYDSFSENHTPFATAFHEWLKEDKIESYIHLPCDSSIVAEFFTSRSKCVEARDHVIRNAYDAAVGYITPGHDKSFSEEAICYYHRPIERTFLPLMEKLKKLGNARGCNAVYDKLERLVSESRQNLLTSFEKELTSNAGYYELYPFSYFQEKAEIERHDYRVSDPGIFLVIETLVADNIEYTISDVYTPVSEMERDLTRRANTFFSAALRIYEQYVRELELLLDVIGKNLPAINDGEDLDDYLTRCCVKKAC
jgi:hypothetical protein